MNVLLSILKLFHLTTSTTAQMLLISSKNQTLSRFILVICLCVSFFISFLTICIVLFLFQRIMLCYCYGSVTDHFGPSAFNKFEFGFGFS